MVGSHSSSEVREDLLALSPAQAPGGTAPVRPAAGRGRHFIILHGSNGGHRGRETPAELRAYHPSVHILCESPSARDRMVHPARA